MWQLYYKILYLHFFNAVSIVYVEVAPPRPPLPGSNIAPPRPPPPETDDEEEMFMHAPQPNQPIMVKEMLYDIFVVYKLCKIRYITKSCA